MLEPATWEAALTAADKGLLNLGIGQPAQSLLPIELLRRAALRTIGAPNPERQQETTEPVVASVNSSNNSFTANISNEPVVSDSRFLLQYGPGAGNRKYLQLLSKYLSHGYGYNVSALTLFETSGNSHGISLAASMIALPGDVAAVEDPSYFLVHSILKDNHLKLMTGPQHRFDLSRNDRTLNIESFAADLKKMKESNDVLPKLLYVIPTGNNPTSASMCDDDRRRLVTLCDDYDITILSDDVYELLVWGGSRRRTLRDHALQMGLGHRVVSVGTFSKILGPGLRLGWIEADPIMINKLNSLGYIYSGGCVNAITDVMISSAIETGDVELHRKSLLLKLDRRSKMLTNAINDQLPSSMGKVVSSADSGYFLWIDLENIDMSATELNEDCIKNKVSFLPGSKCYLNQNENETNDKYARVSFAFLEETDLVEAGRRLGVAIASKYKNKQMK